MRLLRRQVHWAQQEGEELKRECSELEQARKEEWMLKEILLEGAMEEELSRGEREGLLGGVDEKVRKAMLKDVGPSKQLNWTGGEPAWRMDGDAVRADEEMEVETPQQPAEQRSPSPPPTGHSGGFDGDADPYDNYLATRMAEYEERERLRSLHNTPQKTRVEQQAAEADAVGALIGMSGQQS